VAMDSRVVGADISAHRVWGGEDGGCHASGHRVRGARASERRHGDAVHTLIRLLRSSIDMGRIRAPGYVRHVNIVKS
jgi:hypothetical protein